jgi:ribosomal RNA-processing protein 36
MSKVSFGALAKAQDALSKEQSANRKRKRGDDTSKSQEDKLEALRERLRQIKAEKMANGSKPGKKGESAKKCKVMEMNDSESEDEDEEDSANEDEADAAPKSRSSKHAPMVQSSKRMVSRKRQVVDVKKPIFRDPRFDNMGGAAPDERTLGHRYAFLNDYRASEIAELRSTIKKTKNEGEKERLKKKLLSMESQQKTREAKEQQQEVVRDHKKKEKELVKQGKQPFFLKKCRCLCHFWSLLSLTFCSRAKETRPHRSLPEHEVEAARQGHRTPSQEGHVQGTQEHARETWSIGASLTMCLHYRKRARMELALRLIPVAA